MLRTLLFFALLLVVVLLAATFESLNPGVIELDLAFGKVEVLKSLAFIGTLAAGWLLGLLSSLAFTLRLMNERRRLRKKLRLSEAEISNLRSLPMQDAG